MSRPRHILRVTIEVPSSADAFAVEQHLLHAQEADTGITLTTATGYKADVRVLSVRELRSTQ
jgi:threonine synthase